MTGTGIDMSIEVRGADEVITFLTGMEHRTQDFSPVLPAIGLYMVSTIQKRIQDGLEPENAPVTQAVKQNNKPLLDKGLYRASFDYHVLSGKVVKIGTPSRQARLMNNGGTITAKRAKMLYIPAGTMTRKYERKSDAVASANSQVRAVIDAFKTNGYSVWWTAGAVMAKKGKRGKEFPIYFLKKQVTIPARPHIYVDAEDKQWIGWRLKKYIEGLK